MPAGYNLAQAFVGSLRSRAISVSDPKQYEFYGWEFTADMSGAEIWMLLQGLEDWLLIIESRSGKKGWFGRAQEPPLESLRLIDELMKQCSMVSGVSWFTKKEFEAGTKGGSPFP